MPRPQTLSLSRRRQLDQRATFDSTTPDLDVTARTINAVEKNNVGGGDNGATALASALGLLDQGIQGTMQGFQQRYQAERNQGAFLAQKGDEKPSEGQYLIQGYESMEGELHARRYAREARQYYNENYNKLDPEEFNEGLKALSTKYIENAPSDNYLKSFIPVASKAEEELLLSYNEDMAKEFQEQSLAMTGELVSDEVETRVRRTLGIDLEGITERPLDYIRTSIDIGETDIGQILRQSLDYIQERGKGLNLDKQTVSTVFVNYVGDLAVKTAMPELMDFASIEDKSKIRLETNPELKQAIDSYREQASTNRDNLLISYDNQEQKRLEDESKEKRQRFTVALGKVEFMEPQERIATVNQMEDMLLNDIAFDDLSDSAFRTYHDRLIDIKKGINKFADEPDSSTFVSLYEKARNGNLYNEELLDSIESLDKTSYIMLAGMIDAHNKKLRNEALSAEEEAIKKQKDTSDSFFNRLMPRVVSQIQETKGFRAMFEGDTNDALEAQMIMDYMNLSEEAGRPLTKQEIQTEIFDPYIEAETKYNTTDEFLSGESLTKSAGKDSEIESTVKEGQAHVQEAYDKAGFFQIFDKPEDYLDAGYDLDSYSPLRQQRAQATINATMANEELGSNYETIYSEVANQLGTSDMETKTYVDKFYYEQAMAVAQDSGLTGADLINGMKELLQDLGVPEDLSKAIIMDLD